MADNVLAEIDALYASLARKHRDLILVILSDGALDDGLWSHQRTIIEAVRRLHEWRTGMATQCNCGGRTGCPYCDPNVPRNPQPASVGPDRSMGMPADPYTRMRDANVACAVPTLGEILAREVKRHQEAAVRIESFMRSLPSGTLDQPNEWLAGVLLRGLQNL